MGPQIAWQIVTVVFCFIAGFGVLLSLGTGLMDRFDGFDSPRWNRKAWILSGVFGPVFAVSLFLAIHATWTVDHLSCAREARNFQTAYKWDRVIGCYLRDSSGRFIPDDSYLTTRNEGK